MQSFTIPKPAFKRFYFGIKIKLKRSRLCVLRGIDPPACARSRRWYWRGKKLSVKKKKLSVKKKVHLVNAFACHKYTEHLLIELWYNKWIRIDWCHKWGTTCAIIGVEMNTSISNCQPGLSSGDRETKVAWAIEPVRLSPIIESSIIPKLLSQAPVICHDQFNMTLWMMWHEIMQIQPGKKDQTYLFAAIFGPFIQILDS